MKICYRLVISNPNSVDLFPPSLQTYKENLSEFVVSNIPHFENSAQMVEIFDSYEALNAYYDANKMTPEQKAAHDEWKTANNISITYEVYELVDTAVPHIF